ncbi:hypothetical protein EU528_05435 [Candidatus Thorarchaeota archaeon]|nr:MAG: hypothetical protein EU528_05435 [Candidatus Thorarchaeota archaeon]
MKKSATIVIVALLAIALVIPQTLAITSQGLFYRVEDGDRFYFSLESYDKEEIVYDEIFYIEIENASKPIPEPLTDLADLDYLDVGFYFQNGTSMGLLVLLFIFIPDIEYPVGNWSLINSLAITDLDDIIFPVHHDISINYRTDYWGYSYLSNSTDIETTVWIDYSTFDGMLSYYKVEYVNTTTSELISNWEVNRLSKHNMQWGCSDGEQFDFHLTMTGTDFGFHDLDEDFYLEISEDGLPIIPYTMTEWDHIPYIGGDLYWANDTITFDPFLSYSWRVAVPIGNWSLLDDFIDDKPLPANLTLDDSNPWFWGYSWSDITSGDILVEVHTDYFKLDGILARHSVTFTNTTSSVIVGTISIERDGIEQYTDGTAPVLNHPNDLEFVEGTENQNITWIPTDSYPDDFEISVNGVVVDFGSWTSVTSIVLDLDTFSEGVYNCSIIVYDIAGNYATDSVLVNVTTAPTTSGTNIVDLIMDNILYIAIGAGAIILIGAVVLMRRRS